MRRSKRWIGVVLGWAVPLSGLAFVAPVAAAVPAPSAEPESVVAPVGLERPDPVSAMVTAQSSDAPVEDLSQRTSDTQVFANPDGSWSTEIASGPVRVQREDGSWADLDTGLAQSRDGSWSPRVSLVEVEFSNGGQDPFAELTARDGSSVRLRWPQALPAPVVAGSTLTYPGVVAGADLVVEALPSGFSHSIVLHQAPVGPAVYRVGVETDGLEVVQEPGGGLSVRKPSGREVASAPVPLMWDDSAGPGEVPDQVSPLEVAVQTDGGATELVLAADEQMLADPATQFPVTIDPSFVTGPSRDTWVMNADYTTSQYASTELRAGSYDGGGHRARSLIRFDVSALRGKHVLSAAMRLRNYYSGSCNSGAIGVRRITEPWTADNLTWGNQPPADGVVDEFLPAYGYTGCPDAGTASWDLQSMVQGWADGRFGNYGVLVRATDETSVYAWRKYRSSEFTDKAVQPKLVVTYNSYPNMAGTPSLSPVVGSASSGLVTRSTTPTLAATVSDPDGGKLRGQFRIKSGGVLIWSKASALVSSGSTASVAVPSGVLTHGGSYVLEVLGDDDTDVSRQLASTSFTVDTKAPAAPGVSATEFVDGQWKDVPPASNTFTFSSTAGDVTSFSYAKDGGAWAGKAASSSGTASIDWAPQNGAHSLSVKAVDKAGNTSATTTFRFGVGGAELRLPLDGDRSTSTFDVAATAPGGATGASLQWRLAGDSAAVWTTASGTVSTQTGQPWTGEVSDSGTASLVQQVLWDSTKEPGVPSLGLLQLRVCFDYSNALRRCSPKKQVHTVPHAFGSSFPTAPVGPGEVGLFTGELRVPAVDVEEWTASGLLSLGRSHLSLGGPTAGAARVFGPGWVADLGGPSTGAAGLVVVDRTAEDGSVVLQAPWGESFVYQHADGGRGAQRTGKYLGVGETGTFDDRLTLSSGGSGAATHTLTLVESDGTSTDWERTGGSWRLARVTEPAQIGTTRYAYNGEGLVSWIFAPAPPGVACSATSQGPGCRALHLAYTLVASEPRLASVDLIGYDPKPDAAGRPTSAAGMSSVTVVRYAYDTTGRLAASWDPRFGDGTQALRTRYSYEVVGGKTRLAALTPPGEATWTFGYDDTGRLTKATRPQPSGSGTSTWSIGYQVPTGGIGLPDLRPTATTAWGQNEGDAPLVGAAVWAPDRVPAFPPTSEDYGYASLFYFTAEGRTTNTGGYGAGAWQIDTGWYDEHGNLVRALSAANRAAALSDPVESATAAEELSSFTVYDADGTRIEQEWGPGRELVLDDGSTIIGRDHTSYRYDDETTDAQLLAGRPADSPPGGFDLVVLAERSTTDTARENVFDTKRVRYGYAPVVAGDGNGWVLGTPTTTSTELGDGSWSVQTTRYDSEGRLIELRQPGGKADASGAGNDPKSHRIVYYTADSSAADPACANQPAWAGLACRNGPATQPASGKPLPIAWTTGYDYLLNPVRVEERSGDLTRTTVLVTDAAGRVTRRSLQVVNAPMGDQPVPDVSYAYDAATGQLISQAAGGESVEVSYDSWGQVTRYTTNTTGGPSNTATTTYDPVGRIQTHHDGKGTYTYTYDGVDASGRTERRGLVTAVDVGLPNTAVLRVAYDGDARPVQLAYPNGTTAQWVHNSASDTTGLIYTQAAEPLLAFTAAVDRDGRIRNTTSPTSEQSYRYDPLGRLTAVADTYQGQCAIRDYRFDADSNRTAVTTHPAAADGSCSTTTSGQIDSSTFDDADRITDPGYNYDNLGRTRTVPAADTDQPTAGQLEVAYHANDMVAALTQPGIPDGAGGTTAKTKTFLLDAADRIRKVVDTTSGIGETRRIVNHYADTSDSPVWTATSHDSGASWSWERNITAPTGDLALIQSSDGTSQLQLANLHGDIAATTDANTTSGINTYHENTEYGQPRDDIPDQRRYGWLGAHQRSTDTIGGLTLMGARLYNPATGRFLSVDPIVGGTPNAYVYPPDPVNNVDLDGLRCLCGPGVWGSLGGRITVPRSGFRPVDARPYRFPSRTRAERMRQNKDRGDAFEKAMRARLERSHGRGNVWKPSSIWTPHGWRSPDAAVLSHGRITYYEFKTGASRYRYNQAEKDRWIERNKGIKTIVVWRWG